MDVPIWLQKGYSYASSRCSPNDNTENKIMAEFGNLVSHFGRKCLGCGWLEQRSKHAYTFVSGSRDLRGYATQTHLLMSHFQYYTDHSMLEGQTHTQKHLPWQKHNAMHMHVCICAYGYFLAFRHGLNFAITLAFGCQRWLASDLTRLALISVHQLHDGIAVAVVTLCRYIHRQHKVVPACTLVCRSASLQMPVCKTLSSHLQKDLLYFKNTFCAPKTANQQIPPCAKGCEQVCTFDTFETVLCANRCTCSFILIILR